VTPVHHEAERLRFMEARDGIQGGMAFARQDLRVYRAAVKRGKDGRRSGNGSAYRRALLESCLDSRAYLRQHAG
jgi:hypothetical protein